MRAMVLLFQILALFGCQREQNFDQRYEDTANTIGNRARDIDREVNAATPVRQTSAIARGADQASRNQD